MKRKQCSDSELSSNVVDLITPEKWPDMQSSSTASEFTNRGVACVSCIYT